uniref:F-box only protein 25 n=1 Tax=Latimeria chalumnae TaxID=7897 RepID=H3AKF3_LATCH
SQTTKKEHLGCSSKHPRLQDVKNENLYGGGVCEVTAKKRKKDHFNNNTKSQYFYQEKWIFVQKESTRERHGYCTLGEAFNRLDFLSAIQDIRRFNYVAKLLQLIAKSQLTSLSGAAQKNYFNILEKIVRKELSHLYAPGLHSLILILSVMKLIILKGTELTLLPVHIFSCVMNNSLTYCSILKNLCSQQMNNGITLNDLPLHMQSNILYRFTDGWDIINLGQVTSALHMLSEDKHLWKKLCRYHFAEKQLCRHLILSEKGNVDWKLVYFTLQKCYPKKEQYGDTLQFCRHCSILFWKDCHLALLFKDTGHPCTANDPNSCFMPVSPQHFIDLFKF